MKSIGLVVFGILINTALSTTSKVKEESRTAFLGEDFHIIVPSPQTTEVLFKPSWAPVGSEQVLMREGQMLSPRVQLLHRNHLQVQRVGQGDGGTYIIKYSDEPDDVKHIVLTVRDCFIDENVKYGESFTIPLKDVSGPISLEFRSSPEVNVTAAPMVLILDRSWTPVGEYAGRLTAQEQKVTLHAVTASDEGSYTILDSERSVKKKVCLNVKEHQNFFKLPYGGTLKINLILNSTRVKVVYTPDSDLKGRVILDQGELLVPSDLGMEGKLSLEGSMLILEGVRTSDVGTFSVTDLQGFTVSNVYLEVEGYKLPPLIVAVISLLSLLVFLLLVCLVSCLVKVRRRALKARAIEKIAQNAGKDEGDAFRQVVKDVYTRFNEESTTQSQCDSTTTKTEVEIKGLEVSKNFLEMSDSGVEVGAPGLPLDGDVDVPPAYTPPKIQVESEHLNSTAAPESKPSINQTPDSKPTTDQKPDSKPTIDQASDSKTSTGKTPEPKPSTDQTLDSKPSNDQTVDSKPSTDQTLDTNLAVSGTTGSDSKPSNSATPEPVAKATPEAAPPVAALEPATKPAEPNLSDTPASEITEAAAPARDRPGSGPASEAVPEAAPPVESPPSPVREASKENAAT